MSDIKGCGGCGCLLVIGAPVAGIILAVLQVFFGPEGAAHDDPYFQQGACSIPIGTSEPEPVDITGAGMSYHCVARTTWPSASPTGSPTSQ